MGSLKIRDTVKFSLLDQNLMKIKDDYQGSSVNDMNFGQQSSVMGTQNGLQVRIAATHSGIVTRNNSFYLPERMKKGAKSYTDGYPKPVLLHHGDMQDPVGRIIDANYVDTSGLVTQKYDGFEVRNKQGKVVGTITDTLIKDFASDKMPYGQQIDVVTSLLKDSLLQEEGYEGLGHIQIVANITDKEAIQKLLDGRYLTGSVGATTDKAVCSVCRSDWTDSGPCEHKPGAIYDETKCFIIAGNLVYDEYSFVNVPADRHSKVLELNYQGITDSIEMGSNNGRIYEVNLEFPQYDFVNKEEKGMEVKDVSVEKDVVDIKDSTTTPAPVAEPIKAEGAQETVVDSTIQEVDSDVVITDTTVVVEPVVVEDKVIEDSTKESIEDFVVRVLGTEEALSDEDGEKLYDALWEEALVAFKDGEWTLKMVGVEKVEDAKLSTEKRKSLTKSQFCGPGRSFPVPDSAHVTAVRRLIDRAKVSDDTKLEIMTCVNRKAKAMDCEMTDKKDSNSVVPEDVTVVKEDFNHARMMRQILNVLEEEQYMQEPVLDDDEKKNLGTILKRLAALVGKDAFANAAVIEQLAVHPNCEVQLLDQIEKNEMKIGELKDTVGALRKEYNDLYEDMSVLTDALTQEKVKTRSIQESHLSTLTMLRDTKVQESDYSKLSNEALDVEITRTLEAVDMTKITNKLSDGMTREPTETVTPDVVQEVKKSSDVVSLEDAKAVQEQYYRLLFSKGSAVADEYIQHLQMQGKLPRSNKNN